MSIMKYKPLSILGSVREELDSALDNMLQSYPFRLIESIGDKWQPRVDVVEKPTGYVVSADVPGVDPKDIKVSIDNNTVTIQGEKIIESNKEDKNYKYAERYSGSFYRRFSLPSDIDANKISAKIKNGVLTLELPKGEVHEMKYIKVQQD